VGSRIPAEYVQEILGSHNQAVSGEDPNRLAMIRHFKSLMPLARDARKPMFLLTPADGAIGGHASAVRDCYQQFKQLAGGIADAAGV